MNSPALLSPAGFPHENPAGTVNPRPLYQQCCYNKPLEETIFDWDEANIHHLVRHNVDSQEAEQAILDPNAIMLEIQVEGGEDRVKMIGRTASGRILAAVFTFRGEAIRPVTAYDATARDRSLYVKGNYE